MDTLLLKQVYVLGIQRETKGLQRRRSSDEDLSQTELEPTRPTLTEDQCPLGPDLTSLATLA